MYMLVHEFRNNLKECLDAAVRGEIIKIERGGMTFVLSAMPSGMDIGHLREPVKSPAPEPLQVNPKSHATADRTRSQFEQLTGKKK